MHIPGCLYAVVNLFTVEKTGDTDKNDGRKIMHAEGVKIIFFIFPAGSQVLRFTDHLRNSESRPGSAPPLFTA